MRHHITFAFLFLSATLFLCCKKSIEHSNDFEKSQHTWEGFKNASRNSYRYIVVQSSWTGFSSQTTITVTSGKVTRRSYKMAPPPGNTVNIPAGDLEWTENENEINIHLQSGAAPLTLDQIYDKAKTDWLLKRKDATTYFEAKNNGLISSCGYVMDGCQDDCFTGINISDIQALN